MVVKIIVLNLTEYKNKSKFLCSESSRNQTYESVHSDLTKEKKRSKKKQHQ